MSPAPRSPAPARKAGAFLCPQSGCKTVAAPLRARSRTTVRAAIRYQTNARSGVPSRILIKPELSGPRSRKSLAFAILQQIPASYCLFSNPAVSLTAFRYL